MRKSREEIINLIKDAGYGLATLTSYGIHAFFGPCEYKVKGKELTLIPEGNSDSELIFSLHAGGMEIKNIDDGIKELDIFYHRQPDVCLNLTL